MRWVATAVWKAWKLRMPMSSVRLQCTASWHATTATCTSTNDVQSNLAITCKPDLHGPEIVLLPERCTKQPPSPIALIYTLAFASELCWPGN